MLSANTVYCSFDIILKILKSEFNYWYKVKNLVCILFIDNSRKHISRKYPVIFICDFTFDVNNKLDKIVVVFNYSK